MKTGSRRRRWSAWMMALSLACGPGNGNLDAGAQDAGSVCDGPKKTPPNLVPNSGFECKDLGWAPQSGTLEAVTGGHTGAGAVQLTASAAGEGQFAYATPIVSKASGNTYCATAWVKGTVSDAKLSIRTFLNGSGTDTTFSTPVATSSWISVPPFTVLSVPTTAGMQLYVRFVLSNGRAGDTLRVDDVDVWESTDGRCKEAR